MRALSAPVCLLAACAALRPTPSLVKGAPLYRNFRSTTYCTYDLGRGDGSVSTHSTDVNPEDPLEIVVRSVMCADSHHEFHQAFYARLDDERPDPLIAALVVIGCVSSGACDASRDRVRGDYESDLSRSATADVSFVARDTAAADVTRALARTAVPREVQPVFVERFEACRAHVLAATRGFEAPWQRAVVAPIADARRRWHEEAEALAVLRGRAATLKPEIDAALLDGKATAAHRDRALALRDEYVQGCVARGRDARACLAGPVARPMTELALRVALALGDAALAAAEDEALRFDRDRSALRYEIHRAVSEAMHAETERHRAYVAARDEGTDAAVLSSRFGPGEPLDLSDAISAAGTDPPSTHDYRDQIGALGGIEHVRAKVKSFAVRHGRVKVTLHGAAPVTLPVDETVALTRDEVLDVVIATDSRQGYVVRVYASEGALREGTPVQVRAYRNASR